MRTYQFELHGIGQLAYGKPVFTKKRDDEAHEDFEERIWPEKVHKTDDGHCFINPFAMKNALPSAAKWLGLTIPGYGKKTYTARFKAGVLVVDNILLYTQSGAPYTMDDIEPIKMFVPSDGNSGSGKRVVRIFPMAKDWVARGELIVTDGLITDEVLEKHIRTVGRFIGFGSMRVENGGINGRFSVHALECVDQLEEASA